MLLMNLAVIPCVSRHGSTHVDRFLKDLHSDAAYAGNSILNIGFNTRKKIKVPKTPV